MYSDQAALSVTEGLKACSVPPLSGLISGILFQYLLISTRKYCVGYLRIELDILSAQVLFDQYGHRIFGFFKQGSDGLQVFRLEHPYFIVDEGVGLLDGIVLEIVEVSAADWAAALWISPPM
jgi:hypothetical protein